MATKVLVIIANNSVYSTYVKTICYKESYSNEMEKDEAIKRAMYSAFSYGCTFGFIYANRIILDKNVEDSDIFEFLSNYEI